MDSTCEIAHENPSREAPLLTSHSHWRAWLLIGIYFCRSEGQINPTSPLNVRAMNFNNLINSKASSRTTHQISFWVEAEHFSFYVSCVILRQTTDIKPSKDWLYILQSLAKLRAKGGVDIMDILTRTFQIFHTSKDFIQLSTNIQNRKHSSLTI